MGTPYASYQGMIQAICSCGERYDLRDGLAGKKIRCLGCSGFFWVPGRPAAVRQSKESRPRLPVRRAMWNDGVSGRVVGVFGALTSVLSGAIAWVVVH